MQIELNNRGYIYQILILLIVSVALSPIIFRGDYYIEIFDNLDSSIAWLASMNYNGAFFEPSSSLPFLNGISRNYLPSEFQINNLLFAFFEPLLAYQIAWILKVIVGFYSFLYLMKVIDIKKSTPMIVVALLFSILPGYPNLYLAQASLPLISGLFIRYIIRGDIKYLIFVAIYPILSELARYGIFIVAYILVFILICCFLKREFILRGLCACIVLIFSFCITEYHYVYSYILSDAESIRSTMVIPSGSVLQSFYEAFFFGQIHAQSIHFVTLTTIPVYIYFLATKKLEINSIVLTVFALIILNCVIYALFDYLVLRDFIYSKISFLKGWNYSRFVWFNPLLWSILFLLIFNEIRNKLPKHVAPFIVIMNVAVVIIYPTYNNDFSRTMKCSIFGCNELTYNEFISEDTFNKVKEKISYNQENSVAFGFHPAVLVFNKFKTLDMYHSAYGLEEKLNFRKLIAPTLESNQKWKNYYDNWGGRAYIFPLSNVKCYTPLVKEVKKNWPCELNIDINHAREMKLRYIISSYSLNNTNLSLSGSVQGDIYDIYVYTIK
ncbi:DUF6044 family protein [Vibrio sp. 10N.286.52.C3]|uniref:DUF6044 family protein n=1 Tax=Vibrio sp. 10N.286.52.C3 TaxID=3229713 RepID=UPI003552873B